MSPIRLLVVDDHKIVRAGLRNLLADKPGLEVVGEASNGFEALEQVAVIQPDVVLMDVRMPILDGVVATERLRRSHPQCEVLLLSTFNEDTYIFNGLRAGARGYVLKDIDSSDLLRAIHATARGESFLDPSIATKVVAAVTDKEGAISTALPPHLLSERETHIIQLIADGNNNREISKHLSLAEGTIANHISTIINKLGARDRTHAVVIAKDHNLI